MSLKRRILKLALDNKALRPHLIALVERQDTISKTAGATYIKEYISGKNPEKLLGKLQERDLKATKATVIDELKEDAKRNLEISLEDHKRRGVALNMKRKEVEARKKEAIKILETRFNLLTDSLDADLASWKKADSKFRKDSESTTADLVKEVEGAKPGEDPRLNAGNFSNKSKVEVLSEHPLTEQEAETLAWKLNDQNQWSEVVQAVPIGEGDAIKGWYFFGWTNV